MKLDNFNSFHDELVAATRRRNEKTHDIPDPNEFDRFMVVIEELGQLSKRAEKEKLPPLLVGQAMQYYAKCIGVAFTEKKMVPDEAGS